MCWNDNEFSYRKKSLRKLDSKDDLVALLDETDKQSPASSFSLEHHYDLIHYPAKQCCLIVFPQLKHLM